MGGDVRESTMIVPLIWYLLFVGDTVVRRIK